MTPTRITRVFLWAFLAGLFVFGACSSETKQQQLRPETEVYISNWMVALVLDRPATLVRLQSDVLVAYEASAGADGAGLNAARAVLFTPSASWNVTQPEDVGALNEEAYVLFLTNIAVALERNDLQLAHAWLEKCTAESSAPANLIDLYTLFLNAKWNAAMGNHFKATSTMMSCDTYVQTMENGDLKTALATFTLSEAQSAGIASTALPLVLRWKGKEADEIVQSNFHLAYARACADIGLDDQRVDSLYKAALSLSRSAGALRAADVDVITDYLQWNNQRNAPQESVRQVNALCKVNVLTSLNDDEVPQFGELLYRILELRKNGAEGVEAEIEQFARDYFTSDATAEGKYVEKFKALNFSNEEAEAILEPLLQDDNTFNDRLSEAGLESGELVYKAFSNVQGRKTRANARIRGLSQATLRALGLDALAGSDNSTSLDVPSLQTLNALVQSESYKSIYSDAASAEEAVKVDRMVEGILKESATSYSNNKNDSILDVIAQAVQAQVNVHVPSSIDRRWKFNTNDPDYDKYLELKSACLKAQQAYDCTIRSGSSSALKATRKEFVDFITSKDQLALEEFSPLQEWKWKECPVENAMVYYAGKEGAYLLRKSGADVNIHSIKLEADFAKDIAFVLNNGMDLATIVDDPETNARYFSICRRWYELLVKDYWPAKGSEVVIVPIGSFAFINWESLDASADGNYRPLIQDFKVRYESDVAALFAKSNASNAPVKMAGFAAMDYPSIPLEVNAVGEVSRSVSLSKLEGAVEEVGNVCELFRGKAHTRATPTEFLSSCDHYNVMLISTHGVVLPSADAAATNLVFTADESGRFLVHADDFLEKQVKADLIAIPSCNSSLGSVSPSGGLKGLSGSLLAAGAASVVASMNELPDKSTSEIVRTFFKYMRTGMRKSEALRQAKLDYLQQHSGPQGHPVFWSGLMFIGDAQPLSTEVEAMTSSDFTFHPSYGWLSLLLVPAALFFIVRQRKRAIRNGQPS